MDAYMKEGVHLVDAAQDTQVDRLVAKVDDQAAQDGRLDDVLDSNGLGLSKEKKKKNRVRRCIFLPKLPICDGARERAYLSGSAFLQAGFKTSLERRFKLLIRGDRDGHFATMRTHQVQEVFDDL
jgi:hypothetical protein